MLARALIAATALGVLAGCAATERGSRTTASVSAGATADDRIGFFVIGDTGVLGDGGNLPLTSTLIRQSCASERRCDFGLMSGDNIYPSGATGDPATDAPKFEALLTRPFGSLWPDAAPNQPLLFVTLGNHDWYNGRAGAEAQVRFLEAHRPFFMNGFFYSHRVEVRGRSVDIFVIDTEMLLSPHTLPDYDKATDGAMVLSGRTDEGGTPNARPTTNAERQQAEWFAQALAASTADWKLVMGHHPIWQSRADSKFAQSQKLRELILPALCRDADAYFSGHQHTIEIYSDSCATVTQNGSATAPLPTIVSGAGAKARNIDPDFEVWQARTYPQARPYFAQGDTAGYVYAEIAGDRLTVTPITADASGRPQVHLGFSFGKRTAR